MTTTTHTMHSARAAAEGRPMNSDEQRADRLVRTLRHHVTGAIERGEATPIVAQDAPALDPWANARKRS